MATRFGDDEDAVSLEGSSFNDLYVKAPLENTQVGSCDPPKLSKSLTIAFRLYLCLLRWKEHWS